MLRSESDDGVRNAAEVKVEEAEKKRRGENACLHHSNLPSPHGLKTTTTTTRNNSVKRSFSYTLSM